jgi:hypothetical protein
LEKENAIADYSKFWKLTHKYIHAQFNQSTLAKLKDIMYQRKIAKFKHRLQNTQLSDFTMN